MRWVPAVVLVAALAACGSGSDVVPSGAPRVTTTAGPAKTTTTAMTSMSSMSSSPAATAATAATTATTATTAEPETTLPSGPGTVALALTSPAANTTVAARVICNAASGHAFVQVTGMVVAGVRIDFTVNVAGFTGPSTYTSSVTVVRTDASGSQSRGTATVQVTFTSLVSGSFSGTFPTQPSPVAGSFTWTCSP